MITTNNWLLGNFFFSRETLANFTNHRLQEVKGSKIKEKTQKHSRRSISGVYTYKN